MGTLNRIADNLTGVKDETPPFLFSNVQSVENNYYCFQTCNIGQSLAFNTQDPALKFGLIQRSGGPCGLLAVVQAFILKYLLFQGTVL